MNAEELKAEVTPTLYVKLGCPWCEDVEDYLQKLNMGFHRVVVSGNASAMREMVSLSGQNRAPTMDLEGEILADFGVEELQRFLKERGRI